MYFNNALTCNRKNATLLIPTLNEELVFVLLTRNNVPVRVKN